MNSDKESILKRIDDWEDMYGKVINHNTFAYLGLLNSMRYDYEQVGYEDKCVDICKEIEKVAITFNGSDTENEKVREYLLHSYDTRARLGDFRAYCIALEWNRPIEKQYFLPRKRILEHHGLIQAFQDVADDKLDFLFISLPPRIGKSTMGIFFITFMAGRYPNRSILGTGHSTALTQSFYTEAINIITSDEYRFKEIFPNCYQIVDKSAEYSYLDLGSPKRFHTISFRSIDGGTTGLSEASNFLYADDLVKDVETANNPDRLDKLFGTFTGTIQDRKVQRLCKDGVYRPCPEVHIATRWSLRDPIGRLIAIYGEDKDVRIRIINVPCYDENGESNFQYDYGKGFDTKYYKQLQMAEDPVVFAAKYLGEPIEREGRPFTSDQLSYYVDKPIEEPDQIVCYSDVAHGGDDYYSMPIGYVYGYDVYIEDVLFVNKLGDDLTRPMVCDKIIQHKVSKAGFEENNGGKLYADLIKDDLRRRGYRCNIMSYKVPTNKTKLNRILACQNEIKGVATENGTYRVHFKSYEQRKDNKQYCDFMNNLNNWSQKTGAIQKSQHDDAPDSLAGMITNVLDGMMRVGVASIKVPISKLGL